MPFFIFLCKIQFFKNLLKINFFLPVQEEQFEQDDQDEEKMIRTELMNISSKQHQVIISQSKKF